MNSLGLPGRLEETNECGPSISLYYLETEKVIWLAKKKKLVQITYFTVFEK